MYNRSYGQRRPPRIPQNYVGNAFDPPQSVQITPSEPEESERLQPKEETATTQSGLFALPAPPQKEECESEEKVGQGACKTCEKPCEEHKRKPHSLFPAGVGDEELLILGLILLLSHGGGTCDAGEVIPFLMLLLFC